MTIIEVGQRFSRTHQFDVEAVRAFATAAGDSNPLHHDTDAAAASPYGRLIVSGTHTTALLLGLTASFFSREFDVVGVSFGVEMRQAVFADARVTLEWEIVAVTPRGTSKRRIGLKGAVIDDAGQICLDAQGVVQISPKR